MTKSESRKIADDLGYEGFDRDTCFAKRPPKSSRMYSLFERKDGKWVRISMYAFYFKIARALFQTTLIEAALVGKEMMLRPVRK